MQIFWMVFGPEYTLHKYVNANTSSYSMLTRFHSFEMCPFRIQQVRVALSSLPQGVLLHLQYLLPLLPSYFQMNKTMIELMVQILNNKTIFSLDYRSLYASLFLHQNAKIIKRIVTLFLVIVPYYFTIFTFLFFVTETISDHSNLISHNCNFVSLNFGWISCNCAFYHTIVTISCCRNRVIIVN